MASRASTYKSATNFTDYYKSGVSIKTRVLKRWMKQMCYSQAFVAELLCMSKRKFRAKLYWRKKFNQSEMADLIRLMGARAAIKVILFPTLQERKRIEKYVLEEQMSSKYDPNFPYHFETPAEKKRRTIEEQYEEGGENWEQSEAFEDYIFDADELPSRRFMRRRNNG